VSKSTTIVKALRVREKGRLGLRERGQRAEQESSEQGKQTENAKQKEKWREKRGEGKGNGGEQTGLLKAAWSRSGAGYKGQRTIQEAPKKGRQPTKGCGVDAKVKRYKGGWGVYTSFKPQKKKKKA